MVLVVLCSFTSVVARGQFKLNSKSESLGADAPRHPGIPDWSARKANYRNPVSLFSQLDRELESTIPSIASFLVWKDSAIVHERYFHDASTVTAFNVKSVTKSVISAIAGAAYASGYLKNLDTTVIGVLPEYATRGHVTPDVWGYEDVKDADSSLHRLTLRDLLTMQAGFEFGDNTGPSGVMHYSSDPVRFQLEMPFGDDPGDTFKYSTGVAHVFGAALARLVGTDLRTFADTALFVPCGMTLRGWAKDAVGRYIGGSEMQFTARDLLRFGLLYLDSGLVGSRQVLPKDWVAESLAKHAGLNKWDVMSGVDGYGYYWWRRRSHGHEVYCAVGYGGQLVCIVPDLKIVVVTTCTLGKNNRGRAELPRLHRVVDSLILLGN